MRVKGVILVTFGLIFVIIGLIFHLLATFSQRWIVSIPLKFRSPNDQIHYYSLWSRCQYSNTSYVLPEISSQPTIENFVCRSNLYMKYDVENEDQQRQCYESRHQCSSIVSIPSYCRCEYLTSTRIQQLCCILVIIFLLLSIFLLYLKLIASPQNASATFLLSYAPVGFLSLALLLMITTMIIIGASLREQEYEEYDIQLPSNLFSSSSFLPDSWNLYRLNKHFKRWPNSQIYQQAIWKLKSIHKQRFYVRIDWSAISEIVSIGFIVVAHLISLVLAFVRAN